MSTTRLCINLGVPTVTNRQFVVSTDDAAKYRICVIDRWGVLAAYINAICDEVTIRTAHQMVICLTTVDYRMTITDP